MTTQAPSMPKAEERSYNNEKDEDSENGHEDSNNVEEGPPKKRRRTIKPNPDRKFECKHEGCGKSYSRLEHLYRHQLNHTPKTIYRCDFPDCNRHFVRQDLCVRHRERHTTHGSQLHKRDTFAQASANQNKNKKGSSTEMPDIDAETAQSNGDGLNNFAQQELIPMDPALEEYDNNMSSRRHQAISETISPSTASTDPRFQPPTPRSNLIRSHPMSNSLEGTSNSMSPDHGHNQNGWNVRTNSYGNSNSRYTRQDSTLPPVHSSPARTYSNSSASSFHINGLKSSIDPYLQNATRDNNFLNNNTMMPVNFSPSFGNSDPNRQSNDAFVAAVSSGLEGNPQDLYMHTTPYNNNPAIDVNAAYGYPVFGGDEYNRSPFALGDDFTAWLFNEGQPGQTGFSPNDMMGPYGDNTVSQIQGPNFSVSPSNNMTLQNNTLMPFPLTANPHLDPGEAATYIMSEEKRQELLDMMQTQFVERPHDAVKKRKDSVFEGDIDADGHILSLRMMHTYIGSYWYHQHAQLPILHKPTFSADKTPTLLLLAVIAIGATTMDKAYGTALTDSAAEFAHFVIWHIRWEIIRDVDFRPPAKLWVFQTLLLVEVYEKMYATRALHERAHIHHDSTLTLMRRGSSLIGRSASDSPPSLADDKNDKSSSVTPHDVNRSADSWMRWVTTEATRRAAFAAFVLDSIHCTMFGHSAKMVVHEMRLPLPCDEALWSATTPAEVGRIQATLRSNGIKPIMFLDGLKRTLNGQRVRTNSFGRTIIMSGLLSVSWHMTQRDLQIASIASRGVNSLGGPDKWKSTLLRAYDNWKRDFDEALAESAQTVTSPVRVTAASGYPLLRPIDDENIFESRTVLHHLAHIAAHVDIVDCQVFAGANRLLSRSVTPKDYSVIREKIEKWATRATARDAAFYALKFLAQVLVRPNQNQDNIDSRIFGHASPILPQAFESDRYIARDDFLLNRPWVLHISALVVWCYGYALEGPINPPPRDEDFGTYEQREKDMHDYLDRVAGIRAPDDLEHVTGKNRCLGLLLILKESLGSTRWELTHEAAGLLGNAAMKLRGYGEGEETIGRNSTLSSSWMTTSGGQSHRVGRTNMNGSSSALSSLGFTQLRP